jgi:LacI family transcriptional regulator
VGQIYSATTTKVGQFSVGVDKRALKRAHIARDTLLIREGAFDIASGWSRTQELLALKMRPDAIFISNAQMALGALRAVDEAGLSCPRDLALVCFDHLDFFEFLRPRLTCVAAPAYDLGAHGAELVLKRLSGNKKLPWRRLILPTTIIERESSG